MIMTPLDIINAIEDNVVLCNNCLRHLCWLKKNYEYWAPEILRGRFWKEINIILSTYFNKEIAEHNNDVKNSVRKFIHDQKKREREDTREGQLGEILRFLRSVVNDKLVSCTPVPSIIKCIESEIGDDKIPAYPTQIIDYLDETFSQSIFDPVSDDMLLEMDKIFDLVKELYIECDGKFKC